MDNTSKIARHATLIVCFVFISLSDQAHGQSDMFLPKYREDIENYIMTGHAGGWKHCDVIHDISGPQQPNLSDETPMFVVDIDKLHTFDIQTTFSSSNCLLISVHVKSNESLSELIKFGWSVVQNKRLALLLKLTNGLTLDMATNTTKLPFLVAATIEDAGEQFLCPKIGDAQPRLQDSKCDLSYTSYKDKTLRTGVYGLPPYFYGKFWLYIPSI